MYQLFDVCEAGWLTLLAVLLQTAVTRQLDLSVVFTYGVIPVYWSKYPIEKNFVNVNTMRFYNCS